MTAEYLSGFLAGITGATIVIFGIAFLTSDARAQKDPYEDAYLGNLHPSVLNGKPYYDFPDVESWNGGGVCTTYQGRGSSETWTYLSMREIAYRLYRLEVKLKLRQKPLGE